MSSLNQLVSAVEAYSTRLKEEDFGEPRAVLLYNPEKYNIQNFISDYYALSYGYFTLGNKCYPVNLKSPYLKCTSWTANLVAGILLQACVCESRHAKRELPSSHVKEELKKIFSKIYFKDFPFPVEDSREPAKEWCEQVFFPQSQEEKNDYWCIGDTGAIIPYLSSLEKVFNDYRWTSGYGGPPWGKFAEIARKYLTKQIPTVSFLEIAVGLVHNGGSCFTKSSFRGIRSKSIFYLLEKKKRARNLDDYLKFFPISPRVRTLLELAKEFSKRVEI